MEGLGPAGRKLKRKGGAGSKLFSRGNRGRVGCAIHGHEFAGIAIDGLKQRAQNFVVAGHSRLVVLQHVQLYQHAGTVLQNHVSSRKARHILRVGNPLGGVGLFHKVYVGRNLVSGSGDRLLEVRRQHIVLPPSQGRINIGAGIKRVGHVILVIGAVGDVIIHKKVRQPLVPKLQESAGLGRIGLQIIAVQIQVLCLGAPAHLLGAVLINAVVLAETLMAVSVVDGNHQYHSTVEQSSFTFGNHHVAQQRQAGIFAIHLAGVYGVLNEHNGTLGLV